MGVHEDEYHNLGLGACLAVDELVTPCTGADAGMDAGTDAGASHRRQD